MADRLDRIRQRLDTDPLPWIMLTRTDVKRLLAIAERVPDFARWTQHHPTCARVVEAGACSCGLQEQWVAVNVDAEDDERG